MDDMSKSPHDLALLMLHDSDIFPHTQETKDTIWSDRLVGKVVLFNEKNEIALVGNTVTNLFLLPGGGIEEGEDMIVGTKRECREETGCEIEILRYLGHTEDYRYRDGRHYVSHGYTAKTIGTGPIALTADEASIGLYTEWFQSEEAAQVLARQEEQARRGEIEFYNTCFNIIRDSLFVRQARADSRLTLSS